MSFHDASLFRERRELTKSAETLWIEVPGRVTGTRPLGGHPGTLELSWDGYKDVINHTGSAGEPEPKNRLVLSVGDETPLVIERVGAPSPWIDGSTTGAFEYQIKGEMERGEFEAIANPPGR